MRRDLSVSKATDNRRAADALRAQLRVLYDQLRREMATQWRRDLPLDESLFDRWERAKSLGFGRRASIYHNSYVYGHVEVGEHTWIGPFTILEGSGGMRIGRYCSIGAGVQIYTHDSVQWALSGGRAEYEHAPVVIGNCCYIGSDTVIAKGVTIGDQVLIGACSFVNHDIPARSVAVGSPCRVIGRVVVDGDRIDIVYQGARQKRGLRSRKAR